MGDQLERGYVEVYPATSYNTGIPPLSAGEVPAIPCLVLLLPVHLGKQYKVTQLLGPLSSMWTTCGSS